MTEPPPPPGVETRQLTKRFGSLPAVDGVDLSIGRGASLALFGPNGAGKTTMIRLLTLGLRPDGGTFRVDGLDPRTDATEIRGRIGLISHQSLLYDALTPRENLEFYARLYGVSNPGRRAALLLETVGLGLRADDPVRTLSRGLRQRASIARALVHDPSIVLLDEPFTGLDPHAAAMLRSTLRELVTRERTVLLVTHDLRLGLRLCERWLLLDRGRVVGQGLSSGVDPASFEREQFERLAGRQPERP